ncbi:MAG: hypothetical protein HY458_00705 [Parcubacteria group bacterium]|nr:hypothetical protein [Parcubacteria group bacterium]
MKNTKVIVIAVLFILVLVGGWKLLSNGQVPVPVPASQDTNLPQQEVGSEVQIKYTDQGFSPAIVNIKKGDAVVWKNESAKDMWPASALHPTHTVYPGSSIQKCNTAEQPNIFDACALVAPGSSWSFEFLQQGSWKFHNHLFPTEFGTVNVE